MWVPIIISQKSSEDSNFLLRVVWIYIAIAWMSLEAAWVLYSISHPYIPHQFCSANTSSTWTLAFNAILLTLYVKTLYVSLLNLCSYFKIILLFSEQSFLSLNLISHFITHLSQHIYYKSSSFITPLSIQFY